MVEAQRGHGPGQTGHSLAMLRRIATALGLGRRVEIRFPAVKRRKATGTGHGRGRS